MFDPQVWEALMCRMCDAGWPVEKVLQLHRTRIRRTGWAAVHVAESSQLAGFSYTMGLTRLHGHPEVLVSGFVPEAATQLLGVIAKAARAGTRLEAGLLCPGIATGRMQFVQVDDPRLLEHVQQIYWGTASPVPALQAIWSDSHGHWPWSPEWPAPIPQPIFGTPGHPC